MSIIKEIDPGKSNHAGICLCEIECAGHAETRLQAESYPRILMVLSGNGQLYTNGRIESIVTDQVCLVKEGSSIVLKSLDETTLSIQSLKIMEASLRSGLDCLTAFHTADEKPDPTLSAVVRSILKRIKFEQRVGLPGSNLFLKGLAAQVIAEIVRSKLKIGRCGISDNCSLHARVQQYIHQMNHNFQYPQTIDDAAHQLNLSRRRFTQIFRQITGSSWLDYLNLLRIRHAGRLLMSTDKDILTIAFECGYEDISTFYRNFRRLFEHSPSQHRKGQHIAA